MSEFQEGIPDANAMFVLFSLLSFFLSFFFSFLTFFFFFFFRGNGEDEFDLDDNLSPLQRITKLSTFVILLYSSFSFLLKTSLLFLFSFFSLSFLFLFSFFSLSFLFLFSFFSFPLFSPLFPSFPLFRFEVERYRILAVKEIVSLAGLYFFYFLFIQPFPPINKLSHKTKQ